jgi:6-phosphogluconolactonase/glucosamine-6-phosphate isomerase/deaminase
MQNNIKKYFIPDPIEMGEYHAPKTVYCKTKPEFDEAVGIDFIKYANIVTERGERFLVGLSHGLSPSGPYQYILDHYLALKHPELIRYTFVNSKLKRQRGITGKMDAIALVRELLRTNQITKDQILGRKLDRDNMEAYCDGLNRTLSTYLKKLNKDGLDYVFLASTPQGQVAGITRKSEAFQTKEISMVVRDGHNKDLTFTPAFLLNSQRIAFLATKADKRRPLAWLYYRWGKANESPGFLRFIDDVKDRMTVFIDDKALTWPQIEINRKTPHGHTTIRVDMALPYDENQKTKRPLLLMIHGFLGLNTFDALLAFIPSKKYVAAAMHYGSIPDELPPSDYSQFIVDNIDAVVSYFGSKGHAVYILDHSIANTYLLMMDRDFNKLPGIKKYLRGRIASNPFFGEEAKHASIGFIESVILKSNIPLMDRAIFQTARTIMPFESKRNVRYMGITMTEWLIKSDSPVRERVWAAIKERVLFLVSNLDTLPHLNRVPIEHTLAKLPIKVFAIQVYSALLESKKFDKQNELYYFKKNRIPVLVLKSEKDIIAKFISRIYENNENVKIMDFTNHKENDLFREHLFYMIHPQTIINIIDHFIKECEKKRENCNLLSSKGV